MDRSISDPPFSWHSSLTLLRLAIPCALFLILPTRLTAQASSGIITTFAGAAGVDFYQGLFSGDGGPAGLAGLNSPAGIALGAGGAIYIADAGNHRVRRVGPDGVITTVAGAGDPVSSGGGFSGDRGPAALARLNTPNSVVVNPKGFIYIADSGNHRIRRISPDGLITTIAGSGTQGYSGDGGPAGLARLNRPSGVALDARGYLYIADSDNHRIRRVSPDSIIVTVAGSGFTGPFMGNYAGDGGPALQALLDTPTGLAADSAGSVYFADSYNHRIRRIGPDGVISTIAGSGTPGLFGGGIAGDGGPAAQARMNLPNGVAMDGMGSIYIADSANHRIRRVSPDGIVRTVAGGGSGPKGWLGDGEPAVRARLNYPTGVALATGGPIYIADLGHNRVRKISFPGTDLPVSDFDGNGDVGLEDFFLFVAAFGTRAGDPVFSVRYDLDGDGMIDFDDFYLFAADFGRKSR